MAGVFPPDLVVGGAPGIFLGGESFFPPKWVLFGKGPKAAGLGMFPETPGRSSRGSGGLREKLWTRVNGLSGPKGLVG